MVHGSEVKFYAKGLEQSLRGWLPGLASPETNLGVLISQWFSGTNSFSLRLPPLRMVQAPKRVPFFSRVTEQLRYLVDIHGYLGLTGDILATY